MLARSLNIPKDHSFFLFGPRGTGKTTLLRDALPGALILDLLSPATYGELLAHPERLESRIMAHGAGLVVIDEVQRLPSLLNEVHRLIETRGFTFGLTGSSARKLRREATNMLAGRAYTLALHPLTAHELGDLFRLEHSLRYGQLPSAYLEPDPVAYLNAYVGTYLREEVQAEAFARNLDNFSRFLVAASFSQASQLSIAAVARELGLARKTVEGYFDVLEDLLLSVRLPVFTRRARRALQSHPKFFYFDAGVYRTLRPKGPLDSGEELDGAAVETLVFQELRATNENLKLKYDFSYWRTRDNKEVDFVLYGEHGFHAFEVKRSAVFRDSDLASLRLFRQDYPEARCHLLYGGTERYNVAGIEVRPLVDTLRQLGALLAS